MSFVFLLEQTNKINRGEGFALNVVDQNEAPSGDQDFGQSRSGANNLVGLYQHL
jgi:hypothetical protein